jgi:uncharacterized damage-inducible protein DinB
MNTSTCEFISDFSFEVRESSLRRFRIVKHGFENWRYISDKMSIADMLFHLIECDKWMFRMLAGEKLEPIKESYYNCSDYAEYEKLIEKFKQTGNERVEFVKTLGKEDFQKEIFDPRVNQNVTVWHFIVRGNLDHEIHHRGQLSVMLNLMNKGT